MIRRSISHLSTVLQAELNIIVLTNTSNYQSTSIFVNNSTPINAPSSANTQTQANILLTPQISIRVIKTSGQFAFKTDCSAAQMTAYMKDTWQLMHTLHKQIDTLCIFNIIITNYIKLLQISTEKLMTSLNYTSEFIRITCRQSLNFYISQLCEINMILINYI